MQIFNIKIVLFNIVNVENLLKRLEKSRILR